MAAGCGGGVADLGVGDGGWREITEAGVRVACDLELQDCPAGETCDLLCDGNSGKVVCRPLPAGGGGGAGATCDLAMPCGAGLGCYATQSMTQSCVKYCRTTADCAQGTCQERQVGRVCGLGMPRHGTRVCLP